MLFSLAIVMLTGAVFTVASIVARFKHAHWLRRIGPFEISEQAVSSLQDEVAFQRSLAEAAEEEIVELRERLTETEELAQHFYDLWQRNAQLNQPGEETESPPLSPPLARPILYAEEPQQP